VDWLLV